MLYHVTACLYFGVTYFEGFSDDVNAWLPSLRSDNTSGYLDGGHEWINGTSVSASTIAVTQYLRSLYFASYVLTALGRTVEPASDTQYMIALAFMLTGFVITAVVVDNVQKRCTASAHEQKEFLATRLKIQLFLRRQHAPLAIHKRVNSFLDFWWFAHRGAMIGEIINELPEALKRDIMRYICAPVLQTLALLPDVRPVLDRLEDAFLNHVQFILYGQGELIYRRGDHATGVFFLLEGSVELDTGAVDPHELPAGSFFGTIGIVNATTECCHVDGAVATTGSILLFVAKEQLPALKKHFPTFDSALLMLEQRLKNSKLSHTSSKSRTSMANPAALRVFTVKKSRWRSVVEGCRAGAIDPESPYVGVWQLIVFVVMTIQWMWCTFYMCFGVDEEEFSLIHATTASLEMTFLLDMLLQLKLGYSNFGNVVMDTRLIWRRYLRSFQFRVDLIAFLPLYLYNAPMSKVRHLPLLNVNKLFRLVQVPHHFQRMETKLLKYTTELRLFKLVYYTFLLSHLFGCLWFNFASQNATNGTPAFGHGDWMPPAALMNVSRTQQYAASLFWAFGLMSASSPGELPKTIGQCFFSVVVMTTGFFLFAYVIGNFGDVIELNDAENRAFYAKLSSLRHFLSHFRVAEPMAHKFKMYFFFRRYHSITQEHLLARCLPPSLLTDIRIIHLQPMIAKVAFLAGMDTKITHLLVSRFTQVLVTRDEFVYKRGDEGSDMYFVFTGLLQSLLPDEDLAREASMPDHRTSFSRPYHTHLGDRTTAEAVRDEDSVHDAPIHQSGPQGAKLKVLTEIGAGCYFGESVLLTSGTRNTFVQAKASCMLYSLSRESLELVLDHHPEWKQKVLRSMKIHQDQQRFRRLETDELKPSHTQPHQRAAVAKIDLYNAIAERTEADILPLLKSQQSGLKRLQSNFSHLFSTMEARTRPRSSNAPVKEQASPQAMDVVGWCDNAI
ncbi:TPA: hypothetical protein N0F65_003709 [Lagenidium giganteum]|uniref:Cyclic nucleotide-binding domain-containing protein n=1 Tax=Lagenidium giganteum TaxID=4803 RepID=A0AAV2YYB5_9STRA|nr:TPA: hypothetical protein N0F65_003709 [Lagenidium giganteum]